MNKVTVGLGTIVGYGLTALALAGSAWAAAEGHNPAIAPGLLAAISAFCGSITTFGRQYQAAHLPPSSEL